LVVDPWKSILEPIIIVVLGKFSYLSGAITQEFSIKCANITIKFVEVENTEVSENLALLLHPFGLAEMSCLHLQLLHGV
jgi:hypothetical protein